MCSFSVGRFLKLISLIFSLSLVFLILQTQARSCLIALLFLVFAVLLFRKYPLNNFIMLLCILIPLIFVMLYMFIIEKGSDLTFLNIFVDEGKGLDSRYEIWKRTLDIIKSNLIGGNYYQISDGTGRFQMHNIWLHVCSGFGVIICIFIIHAFYKSLKAINSTNWQTKFAIICFLTIIIEGTFEAAIFAGTSGIFCLFTQLLSFGEKHHKGSYLNEDSILQ